MKSSTRMVLAIVFSTLLVPSLAFTQPAPNSISVFADPEGTLSCREFPGGGSVSFYVVALGLQPFDGYEFAIDMRSDFMVVNVDWLSADGAEATVTGDIRNAQVAAGGCVDGSGTNVLAVATIATFTAVGRDVPICVGPSVPTSFPDEPAPGYETCAEQLVRFHPVSNPCPFPFPIDPRAPGCLVLNATGEVALDNPTFGEVKARY